MNAGSNFQNEDLMAAQKTYKQLLLCSTGLIVLLYWAYYQVFIKK